MKTTETWSPTATRHFIGLNKRQLEERLKEAEAFVAKHPQFEYGWHNEYRQELKKRIADFIGKRN